MFCFNCIKSLCLEIGDIGFPLPVVDGIEVINAEVIPGQVKYFVVCSKCYLPFNRLSTTHSLVCSRARARAHMPAHALIPSFIFSFISFNFCMRDFKISSPDLLLVIYLFSLRRIST